MNECILIVPNNIKNEIIKKVRNSNYQDNIKFMSLDEFTEKMTFTYDEKTIYYLISKYKINYDTGIVYLDNLKYISSLLDNDKMIKLKEIKSFLDSQNLLYYNKHFRDYVKDKKIYFYGYDYIDKYTKSILKGLDYEIIENKYSNYDIDKIYYTDYIEDEVVFVANKVSNLLKNNISPKKIKLIFSNEYKEIIKRIFSFYNIKINLEGESIYSCLDVKRLLANLDKCSEILMSIKDLSLKNKIIKVLNKFTFIENLDSAKEIIIEELKQVNTDSINNGIKVSKIDDYFSDDEYVFLLGFNKENYPKIYKDDDYFSDKEKEQLNLDTSIYLNSVKKTSLINKLHNIKNLTITYKLLTSSSVYTKNNLLDTNIEKIINTDYSNSNFMNQIFLTEMLDNLVKYNIKHPNLDLLYSNYDIPYMKYDNTYKKIDKNKLYKYLDNKLLLSYTSFDNYNKCKFKYYLDNILKLNIIKNDFSIIIGNVCHYVLSCMDNKDFDISLSFDVALNKERKLSKKEEFFMSIIKKELPFIIEAIKKSMSYTSFDKSMYEKKVIVNFDREINVTFMGVIDKVLYKEEEDKTYVVIIDYKTGNTDIKLDNMEYGLSMQLPIYLYLSSKMEIKNVQIVGFYLQKLLTTNLDNTLSLEEAKAKSLKLEGYSTSCEHDLSKFDKSYQDSKIIKSMKTTKTGFAKYAKVLSEEKINNIELETESQINKTIDNILEADFSINPKVIDGKNVSCNFCEYKDICYQKEKDIMYINREKKTSDE